MDLASVLKAADDLSMSTGYDFEKDSRAVVVANEKGRGAVVWWCGGHLYVEIQEAGLSDLGDLGLEPPEAGVWVWEGKYLWSPGGFEHPEDGETYPKGAWRQPTDDEWAAIRAGHCPWDDKDWLLPSSKEEP